MSAKSSSGKTSSIECSNRSLKSPHLLSISTARSEGQSQRSHAESSPTRPVKAGAFQRGNDYEQAVNVQLSTEFGRFPAVSTLLTVLASNTHTSPQVKFHFVQKSESVTTVASLVVRFFRAPG